MNSGPGPSDCLAYLAYADLGAPYGGGEESLLIHDGLIEQGLLSVGLFRGVRTPQERSQGIFPGRRMGARAVATAAKLSRRSPRLWNEAILDRSFRNWAEHSPIRNLLTSAVAPRAREIVRARGGRCIVYAKNCLGYAQTLESESERWGFPADRGEILYSNVYDDFLFSADTVLTLARRDLATFQDGRGGNAPRAIHVRNGVPRPPSPPRKKMSEGVPVRFLFLGLHALRKGLFCLLDAWQISGEPGDLAIVGLGKNRRLQRFIRRRWPRLKRVTYHPFLDSERAYGDADALVLPTLAEGSPPRTVLEAASRGMPIITTQVGAEGFLQPTQAQIVRLGSVEALAESLIEVAASPDLRQKLTQGSLDASRVATPERFVQDIVNGVVSALGAPRHSSLGD